MRLGRRVDAKEDPSERGAFLCVALLGGWRAGW